MTIPLQAGQILKVTSWCTDAEQASANVWHYQVTAVGGSPATDNDFAANFDSGINALYKAILNNNATYKGTQVQIIRPVPPKIATQAVVGAGPGIAGATAMSHQTTGLTSWYTNIAGRTGRGRTYWPFPTTIDDTGDGLPTAGYLTRTLAAANQVLLFTSIAVAGRTATVSFGIYHQITGLIDPVTSFINRTHWATQRRRSFFGRPNASPI